MIFPHFILPLPMRIGLARQTTIVLGTLSNATRVFKNGVAEEIRRIERQGGNNFKNLKDLDPACASECSACPPIKFLAQVVAKS